MHLSPWRSPADRAHAGNQRAPLQSRFPKRVCLHSHPCTASKEPGTDPWLSHLARHTGNYNGYEQHLEMRGSAPGEEEGRGRGDTLHLVGGRGCRGVVHPGRRHTGEVEGAGR